MSQVISQGFRTMYEVLSVGTIKPGQSGKMDNGREYKSSVKFRATNIIERTDSVVGLQEIDTTIEFKVICANEEESIKVSEIIRKNRSNKTPFYISGDLPKKYQGADIYMVDSFDDGAEFIKKHSKPDMAPKA